MSERAKRAWFVPLVLLALTVALATGLQAQTPPERERNQGQDRDKMTGMSEKAISVTGCLQQKPGSTNEFTIVGDDGKTYELEGSKNVALADHVGHKVTVTGERKGRGEKGEKREKYAENQRSSESRSSESGTSASEAMHLKVKGVQMISSSCQ